MRLIVKSIIAEGIIILKQIMNSLFVHFSFVNFRSHRTYVQELRKTSAVFVRNLSFSFGVSRGRSGWRVVSWSRGFVRLSVYRYRSMKKRRGVTVINFPSCFLNDKWQEVSEWFQIVITIRRHCAAWQSVVRLFLSSFH